MLNFYGIFQVAGENIEIADDGLTLKNVKREQAGSYGCVAIQTLGDFKHTQERNIVLIVERKKMSKIILFHKSSRICFPDGPEQQANGFEIVSGHIGETVKLSCYAKSVPNSYYKWIRRGYQVFENVKIFNDVSFLEVG